MQARYHVRTANGIVEANRNRRFDLVISNFSKFPRALPKGMVIAYEFERILNLPFTTRYSEDSKSKFSVQDEPKRPNLENTWCSQIDLSHITDKSMQHEILEMLTKHETM